MPTASDVPAVYDVVIDGNGYILDRTNDNRAELGYTPTFLPRTNVGASYGDDQQSFWLTATQNDWTGGEGKRFFRSGSHSFYWSGQAIDVSLNGEVTLHWVGSTGTTGQAALSMTGVPSETPVWVGGSTKLYGLHVTGGAATDLGVHGLAGSATAAATDGIYVYVSDGATIRKMKILTSAWTDFSLTAGATDDLAFLNNTLYGFSGGVLSSFSTAGAATTLFTWKDATGTTKSSTGRLMPFGGDLYILRSDASQPAELWVYDGSTTALHASIEGFTPGDFCGSLGLIFVIGFEARAGAGRGYYPTLYAVDSSAAITKLWRSPLPTTRLAGLSVTPGMGGVMFAAANAGYFNYDLASGAATQMASSSSFGSFPGYAATDTSTQY
jgi:hypothetical protein